jgi:2-dehydropantoate 2-reductase
MIAVLGPGGVGGLLAAALARAGEEVVVVGREDTVIDFDVRSVALGDFHAQVRAVARLEDDPFALIVATKAGGLVSALERIACEPRVVLPLLNGLDHLAVLRARFGDARVLAGSIRVESDRPSPGVIVQTSRFLRIDMSGAPELAEILVGAGVPAQILDSEAQVMWSKLVRLNALACTTSASGMLLGAIRSDPVWRGRLERAVAEAAAVARAEGADVDAAQVMAELEAAHDTLGSSMARDIAAGREPELDAIPGAVLRAAARHGIACPEIASLVAEIR